jgi:hypothetical protein
MSTSQSHRVSLDPELQTEVITALKTFYEFLTKLPWLQPDDVLEPPKQGWPNINTENFAPFQKNDAVIELLKHLPYIRMDGPCHDYKLVWSTYPCDYRRDYFQIVHPEIGCWEIPDTSARDFKFPEWVVPLTYGKVHGQYIMLDTTDGMHSIAEKAAFACCCLTVPCTIGTAMSYSAQWLYDPVYGPDDPRAWRNECENPGSTARLGDILNVWKNDYLHLRIIGQASGIEPRLHVESSDADFKVRISLTSQRT